MSMTDVRCVGLLVVRHDIQSMLCIVDVLFVFFFFQAEDGIRDLVRSRGLGDVYKRQSLHRGNARDRRHERDGPETNHSGATLISSGSV